MRNSNHSGAGHSVSGNSKEDIKRLKPGHSVSGLSKEDIQHLKETTREKRRGFALNSGDYNVFERYCKIYAEGNYRRLFIDPVLPCLTSLAINTVQFSLYWRRYPPKLLVIPLIIIFTAMIDGSTCMGVLFGTKETSFEEFCLELVVDCNRTVAFSEPLKVLIFTAVVILPFGICSLYQNYIGTEVNVGLAIGDFVSILLFTLQATYLNLTFIFFVQHVDKKHVYPVSSFNKDDDDLVVRLSVKDRAFVQNAAAIKISLSFISPGVASALLIFTFLCVDRQLVYYLIEIAVVNFVLTFFSTIASFQALYRLDREIKLKNGVNSSLLANLVSASEDVIEEKIDRQERLDIETNSINPLKTNDEGADNNHIDELTSQNLEKHKSSGASGDKSGLTLPESISKTIDYPLHAQKSDKSEIETSKLSVAKFGTYLISTGPGNLAVLFVNFASFFAVIFGFASVFKNTGC